MGHHSFGWKAPAVVTAIGLSLATMLPLRVTDLSVGCFSTIVYYVVGTVQRTLP